MKQAKFLCTSILMLALASCGQTEPAKNTEQSTDLGTEMTVAQLVQTPGWKETAPGYWEREEDGFKQFVFVGQSATQRYIDEQRRQLGQLQAAGVQSEGLTRQLNLMQTELDALPEERKQLKLQGVGSCTVHGSIGNTSARAGIKAAGYMTCPSGTNYRPSGQAVAQTSTDAGGWDEDNGTTYAQVDASAYGTSGCFANLVVQASDGWTGETYGVGGSIGRCISTTYQLTPRSS